MAHKTKAAMPGRQCNNTKHIQDTRPVAGGQSLTAPVITGTTPLARLRGDLAHRVNNFYSVLRVTKSHAHLQTTQKLGCLGCTALQHTPYLSRGVGCEPVAHTLLLQTSLGVVQTSPLRSPVLGSSNIGCRTYTKNAGRTPELESAQFFCINFSHAGRSKSFSLLPHVLDVLKHDFNMQAATIKTKAIHSIFFIAYPFDSIPRCCNSLRIIRLIQAASDSSPSCCWACSISSRNSGSSLNWNGGLPRLSFLCVDTSITPDVMCLCVMTHYIHALQIATPRSAGTLPRRLTKPLYEVTTMAELQSTQTRPEFTWRFLALSAIGRNVIHITATTEREAREQSPDGCVMVFAGRLPVPEVSHG